ncbi:MAG: DUF5674 family protein [Patescibacteria group bacterium]
MDIRIIRKPITLDVLEELSGIYHRRIVKGVADLGRELIALGGEWHIDANNVLFADGSEQKNMWGFNVLPKEKGNKAIQYNSMINIRPAQGNTSMDVLDETLQREIRALVGKLIPDLDLV